MPRIAVITAWSWWTAANSFLDAAEFAAHEAGASRLTSAAENLGKVAHCRHESGERSVVDLSCFCNRGHNLALMRIQMRDEVSPNRCDDFHGQRIEYAGIQRSEERNLVDEPERAQPGLGDERADALAPNDLRLHARIRDAAEAGEHLELEELRIFETKPAGHFPQRRRLSLASYPAHAEAGVDGRALVCGE